MAIPNLVFQGSTPGLVARISLLGARPESTFLALIVVFGFATGCDFLLFIQVFLGLFLVAPLD